jgi:diguanylate cyclase (GGDEF)-like protein
LRFGIDWIARYGGEEFVVVLPETDFAGAEQVCERLRQAVSGFKISDGNGGKFSITASFGIAVLPDSGAPEKEVTAFDMVGLADSCLYEAKAAGRNRVIGSLYKGRGR